MSERPSWLPKVKLPVKRTGAPVPRGAAPSYEREAGLGLGGQSWGQEAPSFGSAAVGGPSWYADPDQGASSFGSGALGIGLGRPSSLWAPQPEDENWGAAAAQLGRAAPEARAPSFLPQAKLKPKAAAPSRPVAQQQAAQGPPSWLRQAKPRAPPAPKVFSAQLDDRFNEEDAAPSRQPAGEVSAIHGSSGRVSDPSGSAAPSSGRPSGTVAAQMAAARARLAARGSAAAPSSGSAAASSGSAALSARPSAAPAAQIAAFRARQAAALGATTGAVVNGEDEEEELAAGSGEENDANSQGAFGALGDEEDDESQNALGASASSRSLGAPAAASASSRSLGAPAAAAASSRNLGAPAAAAAAASGAAAFAAAPSAAAPSSAAPSKLAAARARMAGRQGAAAPAPRRAAAPKRPPMTEEVQEAWEANIQRQMQEEAAASAAAAAERRAKANAERARTLKNSNALAAMTRKSKNWLGVAGLLGKMEENPVKHTAINLLDILIKQRLPEAAAIVTESGHAQHFLTMEAAPYNTRNGFYSNILTTFTSVLNDMKDRTRPNFVMQRAVIEAKQAELAAGIEQCHASYESIADPKIKAKAAPIDANVTTAGVIAQAFYVELLRDMGARNAAAARAAATAAAQANSQRRVAEAKALMAEQGAAMQQYLQSPAAIQEAARVRAAAVAQGVAAAQRAHQAAEVKRAKEAGRLAAQALIQAGMPKAEADRQVAAAARAAQQPPVVRQQQAPPANAGAAAAGQQFPPPGLQPANAAAAGQQFPPPGGQGQQFPPAGLQPVNAAAAGQGQGLQIQVGQAPANAPNGAASARGSPQANAAAAAGAPVNGAAQPPPVVQQIVGGGTRKRSKRSTHRRKHSGGRRTYRRLF